MNIQENILPKREWPEKDSALKSPWIRGLIVMMFIVFAANVTMITLAFKTSPGLVVDDYYEKGKNYNKSLEKMAAQEALGWGTELLIPESILVGEKTRYGLTVVDKSGSVLSVDKVDVYAFRPSDVNADFSTQMSLKAEGEYIDDITFPLPGVWDLVVNIIRDNDQFEITKRIFVSKKESP